MKNLASCFLLNSKRNLIDKNPKNRGQKPKERFIVNLQT